MMRLLAGMILVALPLDLHAEDGLPKALAPYIDGQTVAVARLDLTRIDWEKVFQHYTAISGDEKTAAAEKQMVTGTIAELRKAGGTAIYTVLTMADFAGNPGCLILPLAAEADAAKAIAALKKLPIIMDWTIEERVGAVIAAPAEGMARLKAIQPAVRADLAAAWESGKNAGVLVVLAPTADLRRVAEETMPNLPQDLGGSSIQILSRGLTWAAITFDTTPKINASFTLQTVDASAAKKLIEVATNIIKTGIKAKAGENSKAYRELLAKILTPAVSGDRIISRVEEEDFLKIFTEAAIQARAASGRMASVNNLKQLALAMHNYLNMTGRFPADIVDKNGKPLLSWRVHLLPYLEQQALYQQFRLDEPWDSEHNMPLVAKIPKIFVAPTQKSPAGTTTYLGPLGDGYLFRPKAKGQGLTIGDIKDGTSNTIMIVETADGLAVEWTKPADWTPDPKNPIKALLGHYPEGSNAVFCDGSVRLLAKNWSENPKAFIALLTVAGGETDSLTP